jgi:hypothetical protein
MTERTNPPKQRAAKDTRGVHPGAILRAMQAGRRADLPVLQHGDASGNTVVAAAEPSHQDPHAHEPKLTVQKAGGRIQRIIALCGCGREIVIECDYAEAAAPPPGGRT